MANGSTFTVIPVDVERNAFNAAFYELGLRWYWSSDTYHALFDGGADCAQAIRRYVETEQAHLLKSYDADFLVEVIRQKQVAHRQSSAVRCTRHFDWSTVGQELGA